VHARSISTLKVAIAGDREIVMTRVFDAPRRLVFDAMTKPELLKRWFFRPTGWELAVCEIDLRVGGRYRYVWRKANGVEMGMGGIYLEVTPPVRTVQTEVFDQSWYEGEAVTTMALLEADGKTTLTLTASYESRETRDAVMRTPMEEGVREIYDALAALLPSLA